MTTTTIEKVTVKQASQAINQLATNFMESNEIDADLLSIVTTGITTNTTAHLRDYMLGMPNDFGVEFMIRFAEAIVEKTEAHNSYAIKTILSAFYFENSESYKANKLVAEALEVNPNYSLAKLLTRVFNSGWPVAGFVSMRNDLHPKVILAIKEDAEVELNN
jgi:hypothetical protein